MSSGSGCAVRTRLVTLPAPALVLDVAAAGSLSSSAGCARRRPLPAAGDGGAAGTFSAGSIVKDGRSAALADTGGLLRIERRHIGASVFLRVDYVCALCLLCQSRGLRYHHFPGNCCDHTEKLKALQLRISGCRTSPFSAVSDIRVDADNCRINLNSGHVHGSSAIGSTRKANAGQKVRKMCSSPRRIWVLVIRSCLISSAWLCTSQATLKMVNGLVSLRGRVTYSLHVAASQYLLSLYEHLQ